MVNSDDIGQFSFQETSGTRQAEGTADEREAGPASSQQTHDVERPSQHVIVRNAIDPVELARTEVRIAQARFNYRVRRVSDVSELAARELWGATRPVLFTAVLVGGATATFALVLAVRTFRRRAPILVQHEPMSVAGERTPVRQVLRSVAMSVGLLILRKAAERVVHRAQLASRRAQESEG